MLELARPDERSAVNLLAAQVHRMHVRLRPDIYEPADEMWTKARFDDAVMQRQLFVAKLDNHVVGYVLVRIREYQMPGHIKRKILFIDEICVDEVFRNQGIGTQIVIEVRAIAKAFGCKEIRLGVYPQNNTALSFYQKCGFHIRSIDMEMKL